MTLQEEQQHIQQLSAAAASRHQRQQQQQQDGQRQHQLALEAAAASAAVAAAAGAGLQDFAALTEDEDDEEVRELFQEAAELAGSDSDYAEQVGGGPVCSMFGCRGATGISKGPTCCAGLCVPGGESLAWKTAVIRSWHCTVDDGVCCFASFKH